MVDIEFTDRVQATAGDVSERVVDAAEYGLAYAVRGVRWCWRSEF